MNKKEKKFLNMPTYPGGSEAMKKKIDSELKYPEEAAKNKIEGFVILKFDVDHNGNVSKPAIVQSLGYGCDEEAIRVVSILKFNKTFNRGVRVKKTMRIRINFGRKNLGMQINFQYQYKEKEEKSQETKNDKPETYTYTINLGS